MGSADFYRPFFFRVYNWGTRLRHGYGGRRTNATRHGNGKAQNKGRPSTYAPAGRLERGCPARRRNGPKTTRTDEENPSIRTPAARPHRRRCVRSRTGRRGPGSGTAGDLPAAGAADTPRLERLTCEGLTDPPAIGVAAPRLGWQLRSGRQGDAQRSYRIEVASDSLLLAAGKADLWDSGEVRSPRSVAVPYGAVRSGPARSAGGASRSAPKRAAGASSPDRPLRRRPHGPGGRRRTVHRPRRLGSHGRAAAPEVRPPGNGGCGPAARQFAGLPRSLDQRPQGGRRLPRSGPLAARQTLAVGDLRRRALPARRRERGGDLARTGMVQTRHVRPLAARRALHRTARAGADRHADRRHVADRLPHGPLLARGAERLPRHGVVERPRFRRRGGRCAAQPALDGSGRSGRARLAAGDRTRQARPPRNAPDGPARPRAGAAAAARTARNGPPASGGSTSDGSSPDGWRPISKSCSPARASRSRTATRRSPTGASQTSGSATPTSPAATATANASPTSSTTTPSATPKCAD